MAGEQLFPLHGSNDPLAQEGTVEPNRSGGTLNEVTSLEAVFNDRGDLEDLVIRDIHPTFTRETGIQPEQAVGKRITQVFDSYDILTPYRQAVMDTLSSGKSRQLQVYFPPLDKHYQVMLVPVDKTMFLALADDISLQKKAIEVLHESERRFRLIMNNSAITVFTMDTELRYTWIYNPGTDLDAGEIVGKRDEDILGPESASIIVEPKQQVLMRGEGLRTELEYILEGHPVVKDLILEPLRNQAGKVIGLTGVAFDITEERLLEARASEYAAQMEVQRRLTEQREQERLQIARDLHDGPLQSLIGLMYLIKQLMASSRDPNVSRELRTILDTVHKQIYELRFFAGELRPPVLDKFGLIRAIRAHAASFRKNHPELHIHLDLQEEPSPLPENLRITLYRTYQEALNNVVRHAQANDVWVTFRWEPCVTACKGRTIMDVRDNGIGFRLPEHWIELARKGHLGLVGMRERAEAAGGTVQVTSSPGAGTTVCINIPIPDD